MAIVRKKCITRTYPSPPARPNENTINSVQRQCEWKFARPCTHGAHKLIIHNLKSARALFCVDAGKGQKVLPSDREMLLQAPIWFANLCILVKLALNQRDWLLIASHWLLGKLRACGETEINCVWHARHRSGCP
jgi:hypothetical protein